MVHPRWKRTALLIASFGHLLFHKINDALHGGSRGEDLDDSCLFEGSHVLLGDDPTPELRPTKSTSSWIAAFTIISGV